MLHALKLKPRDKEKTAFYASDYGKPLLDLYYGFTGVPPTNPMEWNNMARMGAGKGAEEAMLEVFKHSGIVDEDYVQEEDGRVDFERHGITIHGYMDAVLKRGNPVEIKTINNKNTFDIRAYKEQNPRENYVGQLAIYMDFMGVDLGHLFVISLDGLDYFWLDCHHLGKRKYKCGNVTVDMEKEYKRWAKLYKNNILKKIEPKPTEYIYKHPLATLDFSALSKSLVSKMRNGHKVHGDYQILYSPWKDLIIKKQGSTPGYSEEELEFIREKTKGYTSK